VCRTNFFGFKLFLSSVFALACFSFLFFANSVYAATLYLSPSSGTYKVGQSFSVNVYVASEDQAMNTIVAGLRFSPDSLEVKSITTGGSFINLWIRDPSFNNTKGEMSFEGRAFTPGYKGKAGEIATVNFKVKSTKNGVVNFFGTQVLANDGLGTNILTGQSGGKFNLVKAEVVVVAPVKTEPEKVTEKVPEKVVEEPVIVVESPIISSATHPDSESWYQSNAVVLEWLTPSNVSELVTGYDVVGKNDNLVFYNKKESQTYTKVADGTWNFHIKFRAGRSWSDTANFVFNIDNTKPDALDVKQSDTLGRPSTASLLITSRDVTSGIDHYEITIDKLDTVLWRDESSGHIFETPALSKGNHTITVRAVDKASNYLEQKLDFVVKGVESPTIADYPKELFIGDPLIVSGHSYPNTEIILYIQENGG